MVTDRVSKGIETATPQNITELLLAAERGDRSALEACLKSGIRRLNKSNPSPVLPVFPPLDSQPESGISTRDEAS